MDEVREKIAEYLGDTFSKPKGAPEHSWQDLLLLHADQILRLEVGDRDHGLTIGGLIETALKAQEPIKAIVLRARQRPPLVLSDD